jgi:hypothetical protein
MRFGGPISIAFIRNSRTVHQANRVLALLSKMFNLAEAWGMRREHTNPCLHVQRFKESARQRYLAHLSCER